MATTSQGRAILRGAWFLFRKRKLLSLAALVAAIALGALIWPYDHLLLVKLHFWRGAEETGAHRIARFLSVWGDYPTYNLPLAVAIWIYGVWTRNRSWRRLAVICFLGATLAGAFDDLFRLTLGRSRPNAGMPDHFYGMGHAFNSAFQSFPSGHAASTFGAAAALLVADLPLGLIATLFACGVVWARMELNRHYPSDIAVGSLIGVYFGLMVGFGARTRHAPG
jgi:membrane-associated phospholipid phosphatase